MNEPTVERLLKPGQVAEILGVSKTQVYRLLAKELTSVRFGGGTVRVREQDLQKYILAHIDYHGVNIEK